MIVMKFGGTSVEDARAIERVAAIVRDRLPQQPVVARYQAEEAEYFEQRYRCDSIERSQALDSIRQHIEWVPVWPGVGRLDARLGIQVRLERLLVL